MQHQTILGVEWTARRIQCVVGVVVIVLLYMTGFLWPLVGFVISCAALCSLVATLILMYKSVKPHLTREAEAKDRPRLEFGLPLISGAATLFLFLLLPIIPAYSIHRIICITKTGKVCRKESGQELTMLILIS